MKISEIKRIMQEGNIDQTLVSFQGHYRVMAVRNPPVGGNYNGRVIDLADGDGEIAAYLEEKSQLVSTLKLGEVYTLSAFVDPYFDSPRLIIESGSVKPCQDVDKIDLLPARWLSRPDDLIRLRALLGSLKTNAFVYFWEDMFSDKAWLMAFLNQPASDATHHTHAGGLLDHSLLVAEMAQDVMQRSPGYNDLERDAAVTLAFFHDAPKVLLARSNSNRHIFPYLNNEHERMLEAVLAIPLSKLKRRHHAAWATFHRILNDYVFSEARQNSPLAGLVRMLDRTSANHSAKCLSHESNNPRFHWKKVGARFHWSVPVQIPV